jgi:Methyltransferase domain
MKNLNEILYGDCLVDEWQMNDSERLAMMAVLSKLRPKLAIEIGTYRGGSLSLMAQFCERVVSIDIDPDVAIKFAQFKNVEFITGRSQDVLPDLLSKIERDGEALSFILVDGDHSTEGVKRDLEIILEHKPNVPLVMMMHDGFNPACRAGMISANWPKSKFLKMVDIDFIPGRMIEHGGGGDGELWGGLALAYFSPESTGGVSGVGASAARAQAIMSANLS